MITKENQKIIKHIVDISRKWFTLWELIKSNFYWWISYKIEALEWWQQIITRSKYADEFSKEEVYEVYYSVWEDISQKKIYDVDISIIIWIYEDIDLWPEAKYVY